VAGTGKGDNVGEEEFGVAVGVDNFELVGDEVGFAGGLAVCVDVDGQTD
jgi:hypothetical protein